MNGLGMLAVLVSLGAEAGWERDNFGALSYTIRVDRDALPELVSGEQAFITEVQPTHRNFRNFQVMLPDTKSTAPEVNRGTATPDDAIKYGWSPEDDGFQFHIQMTPERFGTFSNGVPIRGRVPANLPEIAKVLVFVGTRDLPQVLPPGTPAATPPTPPDLTRGNRYSSQNDDGTNISAPRRSTTFTAGDSAGQPPLSAPVNGSELASDRRRVGDDRRWQNPDFRNTADATRSQSGASVRDDRDSFDRPGYDPNAYERQDYARGGYSRNEFEQAGFERGNERIDAAQRRDAAHRDYDPRGDYARRDYGTDPRYPERDYRAEAPAYSPQPPAVTVARSQQPPVQQSYQNPPPTYANTSYPNNGGGAQPAQPQTYVTPPPATWPTAAPATNPPTATAATSQPVASAGTAGEDVRPWGPLILTTMALFTSLGANAYLGWLAWSFFWRFKDVASDVVRARSQSTSVRPAA